MGGNVPCEELGYHLVEVLKRPLQLLECLLVEQQMNVVSVEQKTGTVRIEDPSEESRRRRRHFESLVVF
jgi:hypothetical protein